MIAFILFYIFSTVTPALSQFISPYVASFQPILVNSELRSLDLSVDWQFPFDVYHDGFYVEARFSKDRLAAHTNPRLQLSYNTDADEKTKTFFLKSVHLKNDFAFIRVCSVDERKTEIIRNCTKSLRYPISKEAVRNSQSSYRLLRTTTHPEDVTLTLYSTGEQKDVDITINCAGEGAYSEKLGKRGSEVLEWRTVIGSEERLSLSGLRPNTEYTCEILGREEESTRIIDVLLTDIQFQTEQIHVPSPPQPKLNTHVSSFNALREKLAIFLEPVEEGDSIGKYILLAYPMELDGSSNGDDMKQTPAVEKVTPEDLNSQMESISSKNPIPFIQRTFLPPELPLMHSFARSNPNAYKMESCYYFVLVSVSKKQRDALGWNSTSTCVSLAGNSLSPFQKFLRYGGFFAASSVVCLLCMFIAVCIKSVTKIRKKLSSGKSMKYSKVRAGVVNNTPIHEDTFYDYIPPPPPEDD